MIPARGWQLWVVRLESVRYRIETRAGMWRTIRIGGTELVEETNEGGSEIPSTLCYSAQVVTGATSAHVVLPRVASLQANTSANICWLPPQRNQQQLACPRHSYDPSKILTCLQSQYIRENMRLPILSLLMERGSSTLSSTCNRAIA